MAAARPTITLPEPPPGGFTIDDMAELEDLGHRVELISGGLYVNARPSTWHTVVLLHLWRELADLAGQSGTPVRALAERGVRVEAGTAPEPDVLVIRADAYDLQVHTYASKDVVLAVEVVSPGSERRDRRDKPALYAEAGIPHFWRVENEDMRPVLHVYELDPTTQTYLGTGIHRGTLSVPVPWPITLDLDGLCR